MKKFTLKAITLSQSIVLSALMLFSSASYADKVEVSFDLLDGTYVGESKYYYDTEYSDLPGFYHQENSIEHGISIKYIHEREDFDLIAKFGMGDSELRTSKTYEAGVRYHVDEKHWLGLRYKGVNAKEDYELDTRILDAQHQNTVTNAEWAQWVIARYQYNSSYLDNNLYAGFELATGLSDDDALVEDDASLFIGYHSDLFISEFKIGEDLIFFSVGMTFDISKSEE